MSENTSRGARVFLVDDHPAVRQGLSLLLEQEGIVICGEAENREQALQRLADASPDLVLVDLALGSASGLDLIKELHDQGIRSLVYSMHDDARYIESAFAAGAEGYVTKREMAATLLDAIRETLSGLRYISPIAARSLAYKLIPDNNRIHIERLSGRELEIFQRLGEGDSSTDIAERFHISVSTVETYFTRIIEKLGFCGAKEMRREAIQYTRKD